MSNCIYCYRTTGFEYDEIKEEDFCRKEISKDAFFCSMHEKCSDDFVIFKKLLVKLALIKLNETTQQMDSYRSSKDKIKVLVEFIEFYNRNRSIVFTIEKLRNVIEQKLLELKNKYNYNVDKYLHIFVPDKYPNTEEIKEEEISTDNLNKKMHDLYPHFFTEEGDIITINV